MQFFVNGALFASFVPRLPEIRDQVDISVARVGLLLSIAGVFGLVGSAIVGPTIARFSTRKVMLGAGALVSVSLAIVGLAESQIVLLVGLSGMMTFDVLVDVAMNMQGSWLSARRHAPVMNRLHGLWSLGTVAGGVSSSRIAAAGISLTAHLAVAGTVLLVALTYVGPGLLRADEHPGSPETSSRRGAVANRRRAAPALTLFALAGAAAVAIESTSLDWAAFRFTDDLEVGAGFAAVGYVAVTAGMTLGRFGGDWVSARVGAGRLVRTAGILTGVGLAVASLIDQRDIDLLGYLLAGLGIATMLPTIYDQAAKRPGPPGAGLGALTAGLRTASLTVPFLVGSLAATSLSVGDAVALVTLPSVAGFLVVTGFLPVRVRVQSRPSRPM